MFVKSIFAFVSDILSVNIFYNMKLASKNKTLT